MCEFCSFGSNSNKSDRDSTNPVFSGFFSADAIEAAVQQATRQQEINRNTRRVQNKKYIYDNDRLQKDNETDFSVEGNRNTDDDDDVCGVEDDDDDGT